MTPRVGAPSASHAARAGFLPPAAARACAVFAALLSCAPAALSNGVAPLPPPGDASPAKPSSALVRDGGWRAAFVASHPVLEGTAITATFDEAEGRVTGNAGTNGYTGDFAVTGEGGLRVSAIATTRKHLDLPAGRMQQERDYLAALQSADRFNVWDGELVLWAGTTPVIRYTAVP